MGQVTIRFITNCESFCDTRNQKTRMQISSTKISDDAEEIRREYLGDLSLILGCLAEYYLLYLSPLNAVSPERGEGSPLRQKVLALKMQRICA